MDNATTLTKKIIVPERVLFRELDGESVLLNLDNESYYGLDEIGTRMLTLLMESNTIQAACAILQEEYEVEPERLQSDLLELIGELEQQGLVTVED